MERADLIPFTSMISDIKNERDINDFYPTPKCAIDPLLEKEEFQSVIWEPACGDGAISKVLKNNGYKVFSGDLIDRGYGEYFADFLKIPIDFFEAEGSFNFAYDIITNPPFKLAQEFIEKALSFRNCNRVAIFARLGFLESKKRKVLFENTPLQKVYVFSWRVPMWRRGEVRSGGKNMPFAWYIWCKGYEGDPTLHWI